MLQPSGTRLCKPITMPPDVQNIIKPSGKGSRNETEIELNFPGRTPSFYIFLALSGTSWQYFWGKGKKKPVVKFLLTSGSNRKAAEPLMSCSAQQSELFHMGLTLHSWSGVWATSAVLSVALDGKCKGLCALSHLPGVLEKYLRLNQHGSHWK